VPPRMGKLKPKKKCCKSRPRCKRCPVLLKLQAKKKHLKAAA
jgi:hypothetical protein